MPNFTFPSLADVPWSLSDQRGTIVFVNFWATWCPPCREETPGFVRLYKRFHGRVEFAGISTDDDVREAVPPFAKQYGVVYPQLVPKPDAQILHAVEVLPTSFLVDAQGRIARTWTGMVPERDLEAAIEALLAEQKAER